MPPLETEVCVIGGGPAGATLARRLALLGHDVCLLEASTFPRRHVGESLAPGILPLLDFLGLRESVESASFLRPEHAAVRWGGVLRHLYYAPGPPGFQVDRGRFDQLLLDAAKEAGVRVLQPARARLPRLGEDKRWQVPFECEGVTGQVSATYLADASGRRATLAGQRKRLWPTTLAVYAYWRAPFPVGTETRVEAGSDEWFWGAPLPDGTFNATAFVAPSRCRAAGQNLETFYRSLLADSLLLRGCLEGELASRVMACDATPYAVDCPVTPHSIKVGEASFAIDPLSSQGVQAAITSALHGSIAIHTILTRPENTPAVLRFCRERQIETSAYHHRVATQYYFVQHAISGQTFWRERARLPPEYELPSIRPAPTLAASEGTAVGDSCRFALSEEVSCEEMPCIVGDIIRNVTAVAHPSLTRPVAFVKNVEVAPLLRAVDSGGTVAEIIRGWSPFLLEGGGPELFHWMRSAGLIVRVQADGRTQPDEGAPSSEMHSQGTHSVIANRGAPECPQ